MEPITIVVICAVSFGGVASIVSMIHQYFLSRNQRLTQMASERVMDQYTQSLKALRDELTRNRQKLLYHELLDDSKEAIVAIDEKIQGIIQAKYLLVERFNETIASEIKKLRSGEYGEEALTIFAEIKSNLDQALIGYDKTLEKLQAERKELLCDKKSLVKSLLAEEERQSAQLNEMYKQHGEYLDKMYVAYTANQHSLATGFVESSKSFFYALVRAPIEFIASFFSRGKNIDNTQAQRELNERDEVRRTESTIQRAIDNTIPDIVLSVN